MHSFPRLKFCGFTRTDDVLAALDAGADAIGLNFYAASKRFVARPVAESLSKIAQGHALRVGVFVNASPEEVESIVSDCGLDAIQLHGDETVAWLEQSQQLSGLRAIPVLRALPYRGSVDDAVVKPWTEAAGSKDRRIMGLLVDSFDPVERGGTGKTAQWDLLYPRPNAFRREKLDRFRHDDQVWTDAERYADATLNPVPILLAGGIRTDNLVQALTIAKPDGIDLASGIETAPGIKDHQAMKQIGRIVKQHYGQR